MQSVYSVLMSPRSNMFVLECIKPSEFYVVNIYLWLIYSFKHLLQFSLRLNEQIHSRVFLSKNNSCFLTFNCFSKFLKIIEIFSLLHLLFYNWSIHFPPLKKKKPRGKNFSQKNESLVEVDEKMEEVNNEIGKNSDDSSPSPSDSSNNVDEFSCSANDLGSNFFLEWIPTSDSEPFIKCFWTFLCSVNAIPQNSFLAFEPLNKLHVSQGFFDQFKHYFGSEENDLVIELEYLLFCIQCLIKA